MGSLSNVPRQYPDGRPSATMRMDAKDHGVVLDEANGGAREALVFEENGLYHLFYDREEEHGWVACLAVSRDLLNWQRKGPILDLGEKGEKDSSGAVSPWVIRDKDWWHMFYVGAANFNNRVPSVPYLTLKARSRSLAGPWIKQKDLIPFSTEPGTYHDITASPGAIVKHDDEYLMFFSCTTRKEGSPFIQRTLGIARTNDLDAPWSLDPDPLLPIEEQVENTWLHYSQRNGLWFLFTNHIGLEQDEYTDAIWVYWSADLNTWNPDHKAIVLDGTNCTWSKKCIGLPSLVQVGQRLAMLYDAPGGDSTSHFNRSIGLAWLQLPLEPPSLA
jgi:predicted GH43/DUF377 family glycosyl hydrolase